MSYSSIFFLLLVMAACDNSKTKTEKKDRRVLTEINLNRNDTAQADTPRLALQLEFFPAIPDTISGCGDYYTYDSIQAVKDKYIFLSNITEFAIIRIEGKDVFLTRQKTTTNYSDDHFISIFKGNGFSATLEVKRIKKYDEGGFYSGTLKVIRGNKAVMIWVHGETGC